MNKRLKIIITSVLASLGFIGIQIINPNHKIYGIFVLSFVVTLLIMWALKESLKFNTTLVLLILPAFFTIGVGFFWFLLPPSFLTRLIAVLYGFLMYFLILTINVYSVSAIKTIALFRTAKAGGFVFTMATFFFLFDAILSFRLPIYFNTLYTFLVSVPLFLQGYWVINLDTKFSLKLIQMSVLTSMMCAQVAAVLYFWPVSIVVGSLFLTATAYVLLGLGQSHLEGRLFAQTVREYLILGTAIFIGMFGITVWGI
ncbi:MAG: hypothetical protein NZM26_02615 [Patescibacteria group bacterium]|nr:hypothetical protein [Patescibacteria group bacterium]